MAAAGGYGGTDIPLHGASLCSGLAILQMLTLNPALSALRGSLKEGGYRPASLICVVCYSPGPGTREMS